MLAKTFGPMAALAALAVGLAGCYQSDALLLSPQGAVFPVAAGDVEVSGDLEHVRVGSDGWYSVDEAGGKPNDHLRILLNPLSPARQDRYVFAIDEGKTFSYGVAAKHSGELYFMFPHCTDALDRRIATTEGARDSGPELVRTCSFRSRDQLFTALTSWGAQRSPHAGDQHIPLGQPAATPL
jgi:hypothetical protein